MNRKLVLSGIILLQVFVQLGIAQNTELKFHLVEGPDGKPLGKIRNITQDPHGYMWFSGEGDQGVYRYDGIRITTFRHEESNPNSVGGNFINSIYADGSGIIWIGMNEGLDRFDPATGVFQHFRNDPNDPGSLGGSVTPILKDRTGRLWVGTNKGLDQLDEKTGKFIHYSNEPGNPKSLSSNYVWNIYEDRQGVLWVATGWPFDNKNPEDGGLNRFETDGTFTRFMHDPNNSHSLINNKVRAMFEDSRGVFWIGTSGDGLHTMDRKTGRIDRHTYDPTRPDKLSRPPLKMDDDFAYNNDQVTFIHEDVVGSIWIGTMWSGINRYDTLTKKITQYESSNGFPDKSGWNIYQSRDGVLWITTQEDNLYRVDPFFRTLNRTSTAMIPLSFVDDKEGNLWVGTGQGGLLQYNQEGKLLQQFKHSPSDNHSLFDSLNTILSMSHGNGDTILIGTSDGPGIFNKTTQEFSRLLVAPKYNPQNRRNVPATLLDSQGLLWFVLNGNGLLRYNPRDNTSRQFLHDEKDTTSLTSDHVVGVFEDGSGVIWVTDFTGGINRLDREKETFSHYLKGIPCHSLNESSRGSLYLATSAGLYVLDRNQNKFSNLSDPESELSKSHAIHVEEDAEKQLWIQNTSSLVKLNPDTGEAFLYSTRFGISPNSIHPLAFYKDHKGRLRVGNGNGFYTFYPKELAVDVQPLRIITTELHLNNIFVLTEEGGPLKRPIEETNDLVLPFDQNNIGFNFAAIDYREPELIKYFTMLEGYDNTWRPVRGEKSAYYYNVPPGRYLFRIKAFNSEGTRGEKIVTIHITPPWWKTWRAYTTYGLLTLGTVYATHRYQRQQVIRSEREKAQQKELAQAKEIEKAYSDLKATQAQLVQSEKMASLGELTAGIAHEIQNPLNFVNNFSEVNKELLAELKEEIEKGNTDYVKTIINDVIDNEEKIIHHGKRADGIVKGMLQHSRTSSGIKEPTDINSLCDEYLRLAYHGLRAKDKSFNALMKTDYDESIGKVNITPQDIGRVILNLINNAFYAVSEKSKSVQMTTETSLGKTPGKKYEPTVSLNTQKLGNKVQISVKDNGNGIPQNTQDKIFQPFFTTKPTGQGTGLGLSLSYDIIKAHGGTLTVNSREGDFAEFIVELPNK